MPESSNVEKELRRHPNITALLAPDPVLLEPVQEKVQLSWKVYI